jgi:cardiolipin synthase A/B
MTTQYTTWIIGALVALVAIAAATHAILTKRQVSSSLAWVGLILLSPLVGAVLYALFGINRVRRTATARRSGTPQYVASRGGAGPADLLIDAELPPHFRYLKEIGRIGDRAERPLLPGNRIIPLVDGDSAYPAMLRAIDGAETSVALATYIFDNDVAGRAFHHALRSAVKRGVQVRVLIDDVGARYSLPPMTVALRRSRVPVARFMPALLHWRMPYFNLRNHRKILVVDGVIGFTGGMNIRAGTWLEKDPSHPIRDLHFRVEGPVVAEFQEVFAEDWAFSTGERLSGGEWFPDLEPRGSTLARGISDGPDIDFEQLSNIILGAITSARSHIFIQTPYFIPDATMVTVLGLAAMQGVEVSIVIPEKNNLILVQWASAAHFGTLLEFGCRIFLSPPPFDHSKLMSVDGGWSLIGSANLDPRSLQLNFEFNVECYDPDLARQLEELHLSRRAAAREVTLEEVQGRPVSVKLRNGVARLASPFL